MNFLYQINVYLIWNFVMKDSSLKLGFDTSAFKTKTVFERTECRQGIWIGTVNDDVLDNCKTFLKCRECGTLYLGGLGFNVLLSIGRCSVFKAPTESKWRSFRWIDSKYTELCIYNFDSDKSSIFVLKLYSTYKYWAKTTTHYPRIPS